MNPFKKLNAEQDPDLELFSIYDSKSKTYREYPMYAKNSGVIIRELEILFRSPPNQQNPNLMQTNPEDFQVFKIGSYDVRTGMLSPQQPEHVANLHEIKAKVQASLNPGH